MQVISEAILMIYWLKPYVVFLNLKHLAVLSVCSNVQFRFIINSLLLLKVTHSEIRFMIQVVFLFELSDQIKSFFHNQVYPTILSHMKVILQQIPPIIIILLYFISPFLLLLFILSISFIPLFIQFSSVHLFLSVIESLIGFTFIILSSY